MMKNPSGKNDSKHKDPTSCLVPDKTMGFPPMSAVSGRIWLGTVAVCLYLLIFLSIGPKWSGEASPRSSEQDHPKIAATVAGRTITLDDLDRPVAGRIYDLENRIYQLRRQRLDQLITQIVLEKIASERSTTRQELVDKEILAKGVEVSREEIDRNYEENPQLRTNWNGSEDELKQKIAESIARQKGIQQVIEYSLSSANKYGLKIQIEPPPMPVVQIDPGIDPATGPGDAKATVIEFSDYQCPACRQSHANVKEIRSKYPDAIRWVFKDYPMKQESRTAAEASRCAGEQGKFWDYQDLVFFGEPDLSSELLTGYARDLGLDMNAFTQCFETRKYRQEVQNNLDEGSRIGISMTPTYVINNKMISGGPPLEEFVRLILQGSTVMGAQDRELAKK
jgi:protein-disulfide isomerase